VTRNCLIQCIFTGVDFVAKIQENGRCPEESLTELANDPIVGVIGDQRSDISVQVASLLRVFKIPLISYQSTSPTLSDRERFANFFRTVPSDVTQAYAILEILK
jgi:ABC-type branched-subunit amino acid transport system substrate-binding protein